MTPKKTVWMMTASLAGAALACGTATDPDNFDDPGLRTDERAYALERAGDSWQAEIPYAFVNRTGETVYLTNCRGGFALRLEQWQDGEWVPAWSPVQLLCLSPPIEIAAGTAFQDTVRVSAGAPGSNVLPRFDVDEVEGTYRIVWLTGSHDPDPDQPGDDLILARLRTSNAFSLTED